MQVTDFSYVNTANAELSKSETIFHVDFNQRVSDHHLWLSVVDCPPTSSFRRPQRIACIVIFINILLCLNTVWYKYAVTPTEEEYYTGHSHFVWTDAIVALIASFIGFLTSSGLGQLFRHIEQKVHKRII